MERSLSLQRNGCVGYDPRAAAPGRYHPDAGDNGGDDGVAARGKHPSSAACDSPATSLKKILKNIRKKKVSIAVHSRCGVWAVEAVEVLEE